MRRKKQNHNKEGIKKYVERVIAEHEETIISKENILKVLNDQVFSNLDFKRHIKEVAVKTEFPEDVVKIVLQQYFTILAMQMTFVTRYRRKLMIYGFFMIDIMDKVNYKIYSKKFTEGFYLKQTGKIFYNKILSIFKN